jgi:hypothetical protein
MLFRGLCDALAAFPLLLAGSVAGSATGSASTALPDVVPPSTLATLAVGDQPTLGTQFVPNADFSSGTEGWVGYGRLVAAPVGRARSSGALLTSSQLQPVALTTRPRVVAPSAVGSLFRAGSWVRTTRVGQHGSLVVRELTDGGVTALHRAHFTLRDDDWHLVRLTVRPRSANSFLNVRVTASRQTKGDRFMVDNVTLRLADTPATPCWFSRRGIPSPACGALVGATFNSNSDPASWEAELGRPLGVRRTYWGPSQPTYVASAVEVARKDLAARRIPWISFKLPHTWAEMAAGMGDDWTRDLATRLSELDGPVWVAFHHEPEGDGNIAAWKAMQERLAPIVRRAAPNVAYTAILTGWHQILGAPRYDLKTVWPDTTIDIAGFDPYNWYGTLKSSGTVDTQHVDMKDVYFDPISRWADSKGVEWAVSETGYTDLAQVVDPTWLPRTFTGLEADHGIAMTYFNSPLNSADSWTWVLASPGKKAAFANVIAPTARLP